MHRTKYELQFVFWISSDHSADPVGKDDFLFVYVDSFLDKCMILKHSHMFPELTITITNKKPTKKQNAVQLKIRPEAVRGDILDRLLEPINADQRS